MDSHGLRIIVYIATLLCMSTLSWTTDAFCGSDNGTCEVATGQAYTTYYVTYYRQGYTICCGWLGWSRCYRTRTLTHRTSRTIYHGVCHRKITKSQAYTSYYSTSYRQIYYYSCGGWWSWNRRCSNYRTVYNKMSRTYYKSMFITESNCCHGYSGSLIYWPYNCLPICRNRCVHGRCTRPGVCTCNSGWRGSTCQYAICRNGCGSYGRCTRPGTCTCQAGWIGSTCRNPICRNGCGSYGRCTRPGVCTCQSGWTGSTCQNNDLINWCNSIKNRNINNGYQRKIQSNVKVYCNDRATSLTYKKANADYAATRMKADSGRCRTSSYKIALYELWKQHRNIRDHCCFSNSNYYITLLNSLVKYDANFYQLVGCLTSSVAVELRKELVELCSSSLSDRFCPIKAALGIIDASAKLPASKSQWTSPTKDHKIAILVRFAVLKKNYPTEFSRLSINEKQIITDATNTILKLVRAKNTKILKKFQEFLPDNGALKHPEKCQVNHLCLLMKIIEEVRIYIDESDQDSNPPITNGRKSFVLNTAVDYREFMKQKQLDRIITVLSELKYSSLQIANDLKKHATNQFSELRTYFETIETFNQEIATADIGYIKGRIKSYKKSMHDTVSTIKSDLTLLLAKTFAGVGANIVEKKILLSLKLLESLNPLSWIFGKQESDDITQKLADFANALTDVAELVSVSVAFDSVRDKTCDFAKNIENNNNFLNNVKKLIYKETVTREQFAKSRSSFLIEYNKYEPAIHKQDIDEIGSHWEGLVNAVCDIVDGFDTAKAAPIKALIRGWGLCRSLPKDIAKLVALYEEIYDYQFDLMDAMVSYVRSSVALDAAKEINTEFTEITKLDTNQASTLDTLQIMGVLTYVTYQIHVIEIVHRYCNVLEYMERGVRPTECKGVNTNIALLLASKPPICRSSSYRFYHVPTSGTNRAFVDLDNLFAGEQVSFKVPSADWLVENDWIHPSEKNYTFYVKRFEVYLPIKPQVPTQFISTAIPVIHNSITPVAGSTEYILIPNPHMVYEYMTGPSCLYCPNPPIVKNPYTACETTNVSEICKQSSDIEQYMYPSLYSQWTITVKGGEELTVPNPTTNMTAIFGLQLCKITSENGEAIAQDTAVITSTNQCCESGTYRPKFDSASCDSCPDGSQSALAGYYCEKKEDAAPQATTSMQQFPFA